MKILAVLALFGAFSTSAIALTTTQAEEQYLSYGDQLEAGYAEMDFIEGTSLSRHHKKIIVDSLWDFVANPKNAYNLAGALVRWKSLDFTNMPLPEQIRLFLLGLTLNGDNARLESMKSILAAKIQGKLDNRSLIILFNYADALRAEGLDKNLDEVEVANIQVKIEYDQITNSGDESLSSAEIREILLTHKKVPGETFIYVACRSDRNYPCLLTLRDKRGNLIKNQNGEIWWLPALAKSKIDLPFHFENGHTPTGLYTVASVMPFADRQEEFGKNRRLIVKMKSKSSALNILPASQKKRSWWKQPLLALELGRENLRIHGTGLLNRDFDSLHPQLVPSFGCVKMREGVYNGIRFNDQRQLLNRLMKAQRLKVKRANEALIRAHMLIFNLPGSGPVRPKEIADLLLWE